MRDHHTASPQVDSRAPSRSKTANGTLRQFPSVFGLCRRHSNSASVVSTRLSTWRDCCSLDLEHGSGTCPRICDTAVKLSISHPAKPGQSSLAFLASTSTAGRERMPIASSALRPIGCLPSLAITSGWLHNSTQRRWTYQYVCRQNVTNHRQSFSNLHAYPPC